MGQELGDVAANIPEAYEKILAPEGETWQKEQPSVVV